MAERVRLDSHVREQMEDVHNRSAGRTASPQYYRFNCFFFRLLQFLIVSGVVGGCMKTVEDLGRRSVDALSLSSSRGRVTRDLLSITLSLFPLPACLHDSSIVTGGIWDRLFHGLNSNLLSDCFFC